jgi:hypothetical protein
MQAAQHFGWMPDQEGMTKPTKPGANHPIKQMMCHVLLVEDRQWCTAVILFRSTEQVGGYGIRVGRMVP